ncbi:hypothetical protein CCACVL1_18053, partial [Corchorus capsularis]
MMKDVYPDLTEQNDRPTGNPNDELPHESIPEAAPGEEEVAPVELNIEQQQDDLRDYLNT